MAPRPRKLTRAPLIEAIIEIRWQLAGPPGAPDFLRTDPGYVIFADRFAAAIAKRGFTALESVQSIPNQPFQPAYSVLARFRKAAHQLFPVMQIGPGIFAANETAATYDWLNFKDMALKGFGDALDAYPKSPSFGLTVERVELRYRNIFGPPIVNETDFYLFIDA